MLVTVVVNVAVKPIHTELEELLIKFMYDFKIKQILNIYACFCLKVVQGARENGN